MHSVLLVTPKEEIFKVIDIEEAIREAATMVPKVIFGRAIGSTAERAIVQKGVAVMRYEDNQPETAEVTQSYGVCHIELKGRNDAIRMVVRKQAAEAEARHEMHSLMKDKDVTLVNALALDNIACDGKEYWAVVRMSRARIGNEDFIGIRITATDIPLCRRTCSGNGRRGAP
jgi:hypothetical protein